MAVTLHYTNEALMDTTISALEVTMIHSTQDMSVANSTKFTSFYPYREIESMVGECGVSPISKCAPWCIISVSEEEIVLAWQRKQYTVKVGETIHTESYAIDNPYLSWEGVSLSIKYERAQVLDDIISEFNSIANLHVDASRVEKQQTIKERCLKLMYELIVAGQRELQPIYAWMSASKNWNTLIISDYLCLKNEFKQLPSADAPYLDAWLKNFVQILRNNPQKKVFNSVPNLKAMLEEAAQKGCDIASEILNGKIEFWQLTERENPDNKELILHLEVESEQQEEPLSYVYVTKELLNVGQNIELGEYGDVEIREVGDDYIKLSWRGKELKVVCNYLVYSLDANPNEVTSMDYALGYSAEMSLNCTLRRDNLWLTAKRHIDSVKLCLDIPSMSSPEEIEQHSSEAKSLVKVLIERGDVELESLYNALCESHDWRELEHLDLLS